MVNDVTACTMSHNKLVAVAVYQNKQEPILTAYEIHIST